MVLTDRQNEALAAVSAFLKSDDRVFILTGYAGTGKTTLLRPIIDSAEKAGYDVRLMAPTGRAAKVLSEKTSREASTIHRAIYRLTLLEIPDDDDIRAGRVDEMELRFHFPLNFPERDTRMLCIVDEASMVSSRYSQHELYRFGSGVLLDDLLSFAFCFPSGKIIFTGDPAQLPPVGDNASCALSREYFMERNIGCSVCRLTEVLRQDADSAILVNAMRLRDLLDSKRRNSLSLDERSGEFENITPGDLVSSYCADFNRRKNAAVVVTYTNSSAQAYNIIIRRSLYGIGAPELVPGERLIVVQNNYSIPLRDMMNGDMAELLEVCSEPETRRIKVKRKTEAGVEEETVVLVFRDVELVFDDGIKVKCKILESLLDADEPNLSVNQVKAMFIDFCIRHKELRRGSKECRETLLADPYYNALKVKYGYAITCHKAQGGEWEHVYVDFDRRQGLSDENLRWDYTAVTRARSCIFAVSPPKTDCFTKLEVGRVVCVKSLPSEAVPASLRLEPEEIVARRCSMIEAVLSGTSHSVVKIVSGSYRKSIYVRSGGSEMRFDATYNGRGVFSPFRLISSSPASAPGRSCASSVPPQSKTAAEEILSLINGAVREPLVAGATTYAPAGEMAAKLYAIVAEVCRDGGVRILNVVEHPDEYKINYYFSSDEGEFQVTFYFNSGGFFTRMMPYAVKGCPAAVVENFAAAIANHVV